jgi:hypothetical protein
MLSCITLKNTSLKLLKVKNVTEETIYKKCGYKTPINFKKIYTWNLNEKTIELWSKEDTNIKNYNEHSILTSYAIKVNVNNKCIFFLRNKEQFINLDTNVFNKFFNLKETIEISKEHNNNEHNNNEHNNNEHNNNEHNNNEHNNNDINDNSDTISANSTCGVEKTNDLLNKLLHNNSSENEDNFEFNSELSYELYSYSDEEDDDTK